MKAELNYFQIGDATGGNQDWFTDPMMKLGGCAAVCACDSSIHFARAHGMTGLYPFDADAPTKDDYIRFSRIMKPYLRPRWEGVSKLQLYLDGYGQYLRDCAETHIAMTALPGESPLADAAAALLRQIDAGLPVPCLTLSHRDKAFDDYEWHWFMLAGYDTDSGGCLAKAVTYGGAKWLSLAGLWNTGSRPRGGLVLYRSNR